MGFFVSHIWKHLRIIFNLTQWTTNHMVLNLICSSFLGLNRHQTLTVESEIRIQSSVELLQCLNSIQQMSGFHNFTAAWWPLMWSSLTGDTEGFLSLYFVRFCEFSSEDKSDDVYFLPWAKADLRLERKSNSTCDFWFSFRNLLLVFSSFSLPTVK